MWWAAREIEWRVLYTYFMLKGMLPKKGMLCFNSIQPMVGSRVDSSTSLSQSAT
jgi:hypothetical protein